MKHLLLSLAGILTLALALCYPAQGQSAQDLLQQGARLEQVQGDYEGAIAIYQRIVADDTADRDVKGRTLIQLARAYENLGRSEAARTYQRVLSDYSDMNELVAEARAGYSRTREPSPPSARPTIRRPGEISAIPIQGDLEMGGLYVVDISPDGSQLALMSQATGPFLQDISTGRNKMLSGLLGDCSPWRMLYSPDGTQLAYNCYDQATVGVLDLETNNLTQVFSSSEYFEGDDSLRVFADVHDWTRDGRSLLVAATRLAPWPGPRMTYETSDAEINHLLFVPIAPGDPRVVDAFYFWGEVYPWTNRACLMRDERFVFADQAGYLAEAEVENELFLRRTTVTTGERFDVVVAEGRDYMLFGCDKARNLLYWQENMDSGGVYLWSAHVREDGSLSDVQRLDDLPPRMSGGPISQDGNLYFYFRSSWENRNAEILADGTGLRYLETLDYWTTDWTPDGRFRASRQSGRTVITDADTGNETVLPLRPRTSGAHQNLFRDGSHLMGVSGWDPSFTLTAMTWIFDASTGVVVDSLEGVRGLAITPDNASVVVLDRSSVDTACLITIRLSDRASEPLLCLDDARPKPNTFVRFSRSGKLYAVNYPRADSTHMARVLAVDGSMDQTLNLGKSPQTLEFMPDDSGLYIIGVDTFARYNFDSRKRLELDAGLSEGQRNWNPYMTHLHPDGKRLEARIFSPREGRDLRVINNVSGLVQGAGKN